MKRLQHVVCALANWLSGIGESYYFARCITGHQTLAPQALKRPRTPNIALYFQGNQLEPASRPGWALVNSTPNAGKETRES